MSGFSQDAIDEVRLTLADQAEARACSEGAGEMLAAPPAQVALEHAGRYARGRLWRCSPRRWSPCSRPWRPGSRGSWDDCVAQLTPWGFDVAQISIPVLLLHGGEDQAVPFSHGQWLASHIPGAETWFFGDEGHGLRESHIEDVHAWLVNHSS